MPRGRNESTLGPTNDPKFEAVGICHTCANRGKDPWRCMAFPKGIPVEILTGRVIHVTPYKGDHGIVYERKKGQVEE